jgi:glycosyltransferase involved in cell wall biosynthesis
VKFLFFVENYIEGGSDKFLANLLCELSLNQNNSYIILINKNAPLNFYSSLSNLHNINFIKYNFITPNDLYNKYAKDNNLIYYFLYFISIYPLFFTSILYFYFNHKKFEDVDTFLINNGGYPGGFYSRSFNLSLIFSKIKGNIIHIVHSTPDDYTRLNIVLEKYLIDRLIVKKTIFVSICNFVKDELIRIRNIYSDIVIYNGVSDFNDNKIINEDLFTILHIASINENKNQEILIESIYRLKNTYKYEKKIVVKFVGTISDNNYYKHLLHLIEEYELRDTFFFIGSTNDIKSFLNSSDLLVLTSKIEGFPLVILEAFSASLPVISSNVGGINEQIDQNINGYLYESNNHIELANYLIQLINNESLRKNIAINNRKKYLSNFTLDKMNNNYKLILKI